MQHYTRIVLFFLASLCSFSGDAQNDPSDKINLYYEHSDNKEYDKAARVAAEIGDVYFKAAQYEFAKKFYEYGINESERTNDELLKARIYYKAGLAAFHFGENQNNSDRKNDQYRQAKKQLQKAAKYYSGSEMRQTEEHILTFYYGGICHYKLDEYKQAVEPLDKALRFAQKEKINDIASEASRLLAKIFGVMDDP